MVVADAPLYLLVFMGPICSASIPAHLHAHRFPSFFQGMDCALCNSSRNKGKVNRYDSDPPFTCSS